MGGLCVRRQFNDWIRGYVEYAGFSEAPKRMHFWSAVSVIAGALRRRVWIDMGYFKWHANHYIIFVAPPGIVSKSTTVAIAINLLRRVAGINFGPDVVTWPALVKAFAECSEAFQIGDDWYTQCALTLESSEFGNLVNPQDRDMIDLLVCLWDSKQGSFKKVTKNSGSDTVENPWINLIACTTPAWIAGNFPEYVIGGGFTSRCLFVYTEVKDKLIAYPSRIIPKETKDLELRLISDLEHIATVLKGSYKLTEEAIDYGEQWYEEHYRNPPVLLRDDRFGGYLARKQTHIHKLAMVLAASQRDDMVITADDLRTANAMVSDLEQDMPKVFSKIGRSHQGVYAERFVQFIRARGIVPYKEAYQYIHLNFPKDTDVEEVLRGAIKAGLIAVDAINDVPVIKAVVVPGGNSNFSPGNKP